MAVTTVETGTTVAAAASATALHLVAKNPSGRLDWRRYDTSGSFAPIGGLLVAQPVVTNAFDDLYGGFSLFAELNDGNLWQRTFNRYFPGRLANLPSNDFDRDGRTDFVIVRDGNWWVKPSSGLPDASFRHGEPGDVFLPAADYNGDGISDIARFHRATGFWEILPVDRYQDQSGAPITLRFLNSSGVQYGGPTDRPVPGDYDGDWIMDEVIFRVTDGTWHAQLSGGGPDLVVQFGVATNRLVPGDYDGDGRTDPAVFTPSSGTWRVTPSSGGPDIVATFGESTDVLPWPDYTAPAPTAINDIDRDMKSDRVIVRSSTWWVHGSAGGGDISATLGFASDTVLPAGNVAADGVLEILAFRQSNGTWLNQSLDRDGATGWPALLQFGASTDVPVPGDYDADGVIDEAIFRPSDGTWHASLSSGGPDPSLQFGASTDKPVPGDYDGDGRTDPAVFRPSNNTWYVHRSGGGSDLVQYLGATGDRPVPADYDGDRRADFAVFKSTGHWLMKLSGTGENFPNHDVYFGQSTDRLVPGDYDGDGCTDVAVFRPSEGKWYAHPSAGGADIVTQFGMSTDKLPWPVHVGN